MIRIELVSNTNNNPLFLLSHFQILICNKLLVLFSFFFWPLKKVSFQIKILDIYFFVLFFCLLLHRLAVRISLAFLLLKRLPINISSISFTLYLYYKYRVLYTYIIFRKNRFLKMSFGINFKSFLERSLMKK